MITETSNHTIETNVTKETGEQKQGNVVTSDDNYTHVFGREFKERLQNEFKKNKKNDG